jgi:hypothetical protein
VVKISVYFDNCGTYASDKLGDCSLKIYSDRYSTQRLADLPYDFSNDYKGSCDDYITGGVQEFRLRDVVDIYETKLDFSREGGDLTTLTVSLKTSSGTVDPKIWWYSKKDENGRCYSWEEDKRSELAKKSVDKIPIPYLKTDPTNFERLKKAILHLAELSKAAGGKDLFDN